MLFSLDKWAMFTFADNSSHNIDKITSENKNSWDEYWESHFNSKTGQKIVYLLRTKLNARAVRYFTDLYFKDKGIFVEMGSGSSQTSVLIQKKLRSLYCLDFAFKPLVQAKRIPFMNGGIQGNLFNLSFREGSIDGVWNMGVMEHFTDKEIDEIFTEFYRILKPDACAILFWPTLIGWYKLGSVILGTMLSLIKRRRVKLYPNEFNLFYGKRKIRSFCNKHGFTLEHCCRIYLDIFNHIVVVIRKNNN